MSFGFTSVLRGAHVLEGFCGDTYKLRKLGIAGALLKAVMQ
jgi:hypothetical protein